MSFCNPKYKLLDIMSFDFFNYFLSDTVRRTILSLNHYMLEPLNLISRDKMFLALPPTFVTLLTIDMPFCLTEGCVKLISYATFYLTHYKIKNKIKKLLNNWKYLRDQIECENHNLSLNLDLNDSWFSWSFVLLFESVTCTLPFYKSIS